MEAVVKICGASKSETVRVAGNEGATHVGFVFFNGSPRNVTLNKAKRLAENAKCKVVAVTVNANRQMLKKIVQTTNPDVVQLHGDESVEEIKETRKWFKGAVAKAISIETKRDLKKIEVYDKLVDMLLLDAKPPKESKLPGGNAVSFDWKIVRKLNTESPAVLSGGINVNNVRDAFSLVKDEGNSIVGIDVSSGVERKKGVKDKKKIEELLRAFYEEMQV